MAHAEHATQESEREFGIEELFFSTTDRRGVIRSGNAVFARVSGYSAAELPGRPHSLIRHPDMPRCVFRLLWSHITAGRPIAAYVKNRAQDGRPYWVLATVVPIADGYLSVRLKPSTAFLDTVKVLYPRLRAIEDQHTGKAQGMAAATDELVRALAAAGFADYDAFMQVALPAEIRSRQAQLQAAVRHTDDSLGPRATLTRLQAFLDRRFAQLDGFVTLNRTFDEKSHFVRELAGGIRLLSNNTLVASRRLSNAGLTLGVVAQAMEGLSDQCTAAIGALDQGIAQAAAALERLGFWICIARLQVEMALSFVEELDQPGAALVGTSGANLEVLAGSLTHAVREVLAAFAALGDCLTRTSDQISELSLPLRALEMAQITGKSESVRIAGAEAFERLFQQVCDEVRRAREQLTGFASAVASTRDGVRRIGDHAPQVRSDLDQLGAMLAAAGAGR